MTAKTTTDADRAKGVLRNDSMLNGLLQRLRSAIGTSFDTGDANLDQLGEIGISTGTSTGAAASTDALAGKLVIDDAKLTAALSASPLTVRKLLGIQHPELNVIKEMHREHLRRSLRNHLPDKL